MACVDILPNRSRGNCPGRPAFGPRLGLLLAGGWGLLWLADVSGAASEPPAQNTAPRAAFEAYARKVYLADRERFLADTNHVEAAWRLGRACFEWAEFAINHKQRAAVANEGIAVCRFVVLRQSRLAAGHYYLALNLGQLARTKSLGALKLVNEMEREFQAAISLDPAFDEAGAHRSLGMLYRDAPGWPASLGNRGKARLHLQRAVELRPDFPENRLCLLESYLEWNERKAAKSSLETVGRVLEQARQRLIGEAWAGSWADWDQRWQAIKTQLAAPPKTASSPRDGR